MQLITNNVDTEFRIAYVVKTVVDFASTCRKYQDS
jgi:hypothetical protein